jgi:hypothetical protein
MQHPTRRPLKQTFTPFALLVGVSATPLNTSWQQANISGFYDSFIISVPQAAANGVFLGDASIDATLNNGLEILPGVPIKLSIDNERQLYEVQAPLVDQFCPAVPESIPFICWNPAEIYLAAIAPTSIGVILFPAPYL